MKIKTNYPGQEGRIVDAPLHVEKYLFEGQHIPFNVPFSGVLKDDHGKSLVYVNGKLAAVRG